MCCFWLKTAAQNCPVNLDFERGAFQGWSCYTGSAGHQNEINQITLYPTFPQYGRHTLYTRMAAQELDPYGGFPVVCPNGSGYSIRLGNDLAGTEAEGVSYEFTIPANRNEYSLIYHYAVVFQDPNHRPYEQPRMETEITNVSDNTLITCSSFTFYPVGSPLPGFFLSNNPGTNTPVWCKSWTAVTVNLNGLAGKTIRLFFKTADCTFRRHFGYAYIDVNSECSGEFTGATFCRGDSAVQVEAPHGYQQYTWLTEDFSRTLGSSQVLTLTPAPPTGTRLALEVVPFDGYGCPDTLYAKLLDTLMIKAVAGNNKRICFGTPEEIGTPPKPGIFYCWSPANGLSDAAMANPFANPSVKTDYVLTSSTYGGGCMERDTVTINPVVIDRSIDLLGKDTFCIGYGDSAVLYLQGEGDVRWYMDNNVLVGTAAKRYNVTQSGSYHAVLSREGCTTETDKKTVLIEAPKRGMAYQVLYVLADNPVPLQARPFGNKYLWQPGNNLSTTISAVTEFNGMSDQAYTVQISTPAGCLTVDTQLIKIVSRIDILVPTAFTPNGDGRNDLLRPALFGMKELSYFHVYNRWGKLVFQTADPRQGWDGRIGGKIQANQTVVWVAEATGMNGKKYQRKGTAICVQ